MTRPYIRRTPDGWAIYPSRNARHPLARKHDTWRAAYSAARRMMGGKP